MSVTDSRNKIDSNDTIVDNTLDDEEEDTKPALFGLVSELNMLIFILIIVVVICICLILVIICLVCMKNGKSSNDNTTITTTTNSSKRKKSHTKKTSRSRSSTETSRKMKNPRMKKGDKSNLGHPELAHLKSKSIGSSLESVDINVHSGRSRNSFDLRMNNHNDHNDDSNSNNVDIGNVNNININNQQIAPVDDNIYDRENANKNEHEEKQYVHHQHNSYNDNNDDDEIDEQIEGKQNNQCHMEVDGAAIGQLAITSSFAHGQKRQHNINNRHGEYSNVAPKAYSQINSTSASINDSDIDNYSSNYSSKASSVSPNARQLHMHVDGKRMAHLDRFGGKRFKNKNKNKENGDYKRVSVSEISRSCEPQENSGQQKQRELNTLLEENDRALDILIGNDKDNNNGNNKNYNNRDGDGDGDGDAGSDSESMSDSSGLFGVVDDGDIKTRGGLYTPGKPIRGYANRQRPTKVNDKNKDENKSKSKLNKNKKVTTKELRLNRKERRKRFGNRANSSSRSKRNISQQL